MAEDPPIISTLAKFKFDDPAEAYRQARRRIINNALRRQQKSLDLSGYGLVDLPPEIGSLASLENLELQRNRLTRLPPEIGELKRLKRLYLSRNTLSFLPNEVWAMPALRTLDVGHNQFSELPLAVQNLTRLEYLKLNNNELTKLPAEIGNLAKLIDLDLQGNHIRELPTTIGRLVSLQQLDLNENELTRLPEDIAELVNLSSLALSGNRVTSLPDRIGDLPKLAWLDIDSNNVEVLPASIGRMQSLENLHMSNTGLKSIPPQIGSLLNLESLSVSGNDLVSLPAEIGLLKNLVRLDVSSNKLSSLPPEIGKLESLARLFADNNELENIPSEVGDLSRLFRLILRNNRITTLPTSISKLTRLLLLDLANNQISNLPSELGYVRSLDLAVHKRQQGYPRPTTVTRTNAVGLFITRNPLVDPLPALIEPGQPSATTNVLSWLRGELDVSSVPTQAARPTDKILLPSEPLLEAGPSFHISDGRFDLIAVQETGPFDAVTQGLLLDRLRGQATLLQDANVKVGNQHPLLVRTTNEYAEILSAPLSETDVVNLWAIGNSILAQALAFERQDAHKTISEPLEPAHLALLIEVSRLHGGFILGFPAGIALTSRADAARIAPESVRQIERPISEILSSLSKQRRLVSARVRGLADALEAALLTASWETARVGHTSYVTLRNFLIAAGRTIMLANDKSSTFTGGVILTVAVQQAGLSAEAAVQLLDFMRSNTSEILSFVAPFPELRAWVAWIIDHFDERDGEKKKG